jgi:hypothetical protein
MNVHLFWSLKCNLKQRVYGFIYPNNRKPTSVFRATMVSELSELPANFIPFLRPPHACLSLPRLDARLLEKRGHIHMNE